VVGIDTIGVKVVVHDGVVVRCFKVDSIGVVVDIGVVDGVVV